MKKLLCTLIGLSLLVSLAACGGEKADEGSAPAAESSDPVAESSAPGVVAASRRPRRMPDHRLPKSSTVSRSTKNALLRRLRQRAAASARSAHKTRAVSAEHAKRVPNATPASQKIAARASLRRTGKRHTLHLSTPHPSCDYRPSSARTRRASPLGRCAMRRAARSSAFGPLSSFMTSSLLKPCLR